MLYHVYEMQHAAVAPFRAAAHAGNDIFSNPLNPWTYTPIGRTVAAACDLFEATTRRYGKPAFGLTETEIDGHAVPVTERVLWSSPFCETIHFERQPDRLRELKRTDDPKVLVVAPMSGHYATLLRGTVEALLPHHEVFVTDWADARVVPRRAGRFDLNDYVDHLIAMLRVLGPDTHMMAVCQPGPAALAATAVMAAEDDPARPASLTVMGSPIDTRKSPTVPNEFAKSRPLQWFEDNLIMTVPWPHGGFGRQVYPGFVQLSSFIAMNRDRHIDAHRRYFENLVKGDGDNVDKHREFYDEYLAVMDLTSEFYLQTIDEIFQRHLLADGLMTHRGRTVDTAAIRDVALMTVEGENDDISGLGQTQAAHDLCPNVPQAMQRDWVQPGVGHYGVFNGSKWRRDIRPRVTDFIHAHRRKSGRGAAH